MLIKRIVTAGILMPLVIGGVIYLPPMIFDLLALLIILLAVWEFSGLFKWLYKKRVIFTGAIGLIILFMEFIYLTYMVGGEFVYFISRIILILLLPSILLIGVLWWLITPYFLWCYIKRGYKGFVKPEILGSIMFTSCWVSLFVLRSSGSLPICLLLFLIWAADIGAYFVGRFFGKHPLAPKISPKKTIEGVGGGVLTSLVVAIVFIVWQTSTTELNKIKIISFLILSLIVSLWTVIGDLFESVLKRQAEVKDSGGLLPGHGGIYDRIDSLIAAAPIFSLGYFLIELLI